jgi:hypothetical protein
MLTVGRDRHAFDWLRFRQLRQQGLNARIASRRRGERTRRNSQQQQNGQARTLRHGGIPTQGIAHATTMARAGQVQDGTGREPSRNQCATVAGEADD